MNLDDTPAECAFREQARAWIAANAPHEYAARFAAATFGSLPLEEPELLRVSRDWQRRKVEAGWACIDWPKEHGGRGASAIEAAIWKQEEGVYAVLAVMFRVGFGMAAPAILRWGSEAQKRRYLPPLRSGEEIWCQMFSEPAAGSDLAGLRTRAVRDGDGWRISGRKVWTSLAHVADFGILLARTDPSLPKHRGLTMFIVDLRLPGVAVRPIRQANGASGFNEISLDDVRIDDASRLGEVNRGWDVALTTLMGERLDLGLRMGGGFPELLELCQRVHTERGRAIDDPAVRARLAHWAARASGVRYTGYRALSALSRGERPGPESSVSKLVISTDMQAMAEFALDLMGPAGIVTDPDLAPDRARLQRLLLRAPATRIEGGTSEILRNIVAERVLGLPGEPRVDKDRPFDAIDG
ncbi:MAG: acyl-CoA dehydrogenase family protein [Steroidobacteraceae bacterium]